MTSPFLIDEGAVMIPAGFQDRSTNIFIQGKAEGSTLNLNIARDMLEESESLPQYVSRQIKLLNEKMPGYKLGGRIPAQLGAALIAGEQIDASYKNAGRTLYQRQAAFSVSGTRFGPARVLIFSATSAQAFDATRNALWAEWLASFTPRV